jgi:predicted ATPase/DNA-binding winged helix-turn-helix (wHTH) protein
MVEGAGREAYFGPFHLIPSRRLLLHGTAPVRLSGPAFNVLLALIDSAGQIVDRDILIQRAWGTIHVEEGNLRSAIASLRHALRDAGFTGPSVATVARRGYRLVVPVVFGDAAAERGHAPARLSTMWGRDALIDQLVNDIGRHRQITIVGPGGVGKTALALSAARLAVHERVVDACHVIELDTISNDGEIPKALLSGFGILTDSPASMSDVEAFLESRSMLIVLDSCERCLPAVGKLTERILGIARDVRFLITCREPLRTDGERIRRLEPLSFPCPSVAVRASQALDYAAVALFVDRAVSSCPDFHFTDEMAPLVASVCRSLDGIPLAIEVVAARLDSFELPALVDVLHGHFRLQILGKSTGSARHRTLGTSLDWSFDTLSDSERIVFRRLSAFRGTFTFEAARQVASGDGIAAEEVSGVLAGLAAKSLVASGRGQTQGRQRLLDTTRIYAGIKLEESGESYAVYRRHAIYCAQILSAAKTRSDLIWREDWERAYCHDLDQIRKALDWAISPSGDASLGLALILDALPLWGHLGFEEEGRAQAHRLAALSGIRDPAIKNENHDRVVQMAAERLRNCGLESLSIVDLINEGGLSTSRFSKQFESREALIVEALSAASGGLRGMANTDGDATGTSEFATTVATYLGKRHRDNPGQGCAIGALLSDLGRAGDVTKSLSTELIRRDIELLSTSLEGLSGPQKRARAVASYSAMIGALGLSRAVIDADLSAEILASAGQQIVEMSVVNGTAASDATECKEAIQA